MPFIPFLYYSASISGESWVLNLLRHEGIGVPFEPLYYDNAYIKVSFINWGSIHRGYHNEGGRGKGTEWKKV